MLIDEFLPDYHVFEKHEILVNASPERLYPIILSLDFSDSVLIRSLFRMRGLPHERLTIPGVQAIGFGLLGQTENREYLLGLIGRFWKIRGDLQKTSADTFKKFDRKGYAKTVWNFSLSPGNAGTVVTTETRIQCLDRESRKRFKRYWFFIGPFSALIRREILRLIKKEGERE